MAKSLTLGNGNLLVGINLHGEVSDLYFPRVGFDSHIGKDDLHRVGVYMDGKLSWISDGSWNISIDCDKETAVGKTKAHNEELGIELKFSDVVYNEKNIFIRQVTVVSTDGAPKRLKLYFGQEFHISEVQRGDTGYFDPRCDAIVHYKGRRAFLVNARYGSKRFDDFTVGLFEIEGREGSYKDAENGILSRNPIEHGSVDSVIGFSLEVNGKQDEVIHYWLAAGRSVDEVRELNDYILKRTPQYLMRTSRDFWHAWVNKQNFSFHGLSKPIISLFKKSLIVVRSHVGSEGAIIASGDSEVLKQGRDMYTYVWMRDGAFIANALDRSGYSHVSKRFFEFANRVLTPEGYFLHKYLPDGSLGASWHPWLYEGKPELPIQEDETAVTLAMLWDHYYISKDLEFIESVYNSLIKRAGDFLVSRIDPKTNLTLPTYDLWEERYGVSAFTSASKYGALMSCARFAKLLGKRDEQAKYEKAAGRIKKGIEEHFFNENRNMFYKRIKVWDDGHLEYDDTLDMSSFYGMFRFGVFDPLDDRLVASRETIERELMNHNQAGGIPRYEGDQYFKLSDDAPSNPWIITTLWLAQYYIAIAQKEKDLDKAKELLSWAQKSASKSGIMAEQVNPYTSEPLSVAPLIWSHATYVNTIIDYLEKLEAFGVCEACNPVW